MVYRPPKSNVIAGGVDSFVEDNQHVPRSPSIALSGEHVASWELVADAFICANGIGAPLTAAGTEGNREVNR
jgi:hypothetical protein